MELLLFFIAMIFIVGQMIGKAMKPSGGGKPRPRTTGSNPGTRPQPSTKTMDEMFFPKKTVTDSQQKAAAPDLYDAGSGEGLAQETDYDHETHATVRKKYRRKVQELAQQVSDAEVYVPPVPSPVHTTEIGGEGPRLSFDRDRIVQGIIFSEILGKPKGRRGR